MKRLDILQNASHKDFSFRKLTTNDKVLYLDWFNNNKVRRNLQPTTPRTEEEITKWLSNTTQRSDMQYYIINTGGGKSIGHSGIKNIDESLNTAELSCVIGDEKSIGSSFGLLAMANFIDFTFEQYDFNSVYLLRNKNILGKNFLTNFGFTFNPGKDYDRYTLDKKAYNKLKEITVTSQRP